MAKRKTAPKSTDIIVEFKKNFQGALNNTYFNCKVGDKLKVTEAEKKWLLSKEVI